MVFVTKVKNQIRTHAPKIKGKKKKGDYDSCQCYCFAFLKMKTIRSQ